MLKSNAPRMTYREAKQIVKELPIKRLQLSQNAAESRDLLRQQEAIAKDVAQTQSEQALSEQVIPLTEEQRRLQLARRNTQESLAKTQAQQTVQNRQNIQALRTQRQAEETALANKTATESQALTEATGKPPDQIRFAGESQQARKEAVEKAQSEIRQTHKGILDIAERPANVTTKIEQRPTGLLDQNGKPLMESVEKKVAGEIDATGLKEALGQDYQNLIGEIQVAVNNGSPGARALMQIATGPDRYTLRQALDIKAALNQIGYGRADAALSTKSEALARQVAYKLRQSIRSQVENFKDGGKEAIALMDKEAQQVAGRDAIFKTPAAKATARSMERYGDATRLKDPVSVKVWMDQVDEPTRLGAKSQVAHDLLSAGPEKFSAKWKMMDPETKALWFSVDEIKKGDEIANASQEGLKAIAIKYKQAEADRITKAVENSAVIRNKRAELNQLQTNIEELRAKAAQATEAEASKLKGQRLLAEAKYQKGIADLRKDVSTVRQNFIRQQQMAQEKIDKIQKYKRIGWIALAAAVGSQASGIYRGFHSALIGEP